jgi:gliding motility-associated-like protein
MRYIFPLLAGCILLFSSCSKEEADGFEPQIAVAMDYKTNATGDTIYRLYMPNAFTPDGDFRNDYYQVYGIGWNPQAYEMNIFSREGNLIHRSSNPYLYWDGRMQGSGELLPGGQYTVDVKVADTTQEVHHYVYHIVMLR